MIRFVHSALPLADLCPSPPPSCYRQELPFVLDGVKFRKRLDPVVETAGSNAKRTVQMTEAFACKKEWIHFSNESVESLFESWVNEARRRRSRPGMEVVEDFLRRTLDRDGPGCRAFGLYGEYVPEEIADPAALDALATLVRTTLEHPQTVAGIAWTDELANSWKSRLRTMLDSLTAQINSTG